MNEVNIHEAKTHFSKLIQRVQQGEEITVAKNGRPVAKLVPIPPRLPQRSPGSAKGEVWMAEDFDAPLPEDLEKAFYE